MSSYEGPMEMMSDPEMVPLLNECVEFVRYHSTPEAEDTEEWHEFKERMLAGQPEAFDMLQSVWERYQTHLNQQSRTSLLRQLEKPEPTPDPPRHPRIAGRGSDEAIHKLYKGIVRAVTDSHRRRR